jgi:hypothetical protein
MLPVVSWNQIVSEVASGQEQGSRPIDVHGAGLQRSCPSNMRRADAESPENAVTICQSLSKGITQRPTECASSWSGFLTVSASTPVPQLRSFFKLVRAQSRCHWFHRTLLFACFRLCHVSTLHACTCLLYDDVQRDITDACLISNNCLRRELILPAHLAQLMTDTQCSRLHRLCYDS